MIVQRVPDPGDLRSGPNRSPRLSGGRYTQSSCTRGAIIFATRSWPTYRPPPMYVSVIGVFKGSTCKTPAFALVICMTLVSACSSIASPGRGEMPDRGAKIRTHSAVVSVTRQGNQAQVIDQVASGWLAAEGAFADAARTSDPFAPELAATTLAPQLGWTRSLLERMSAAGLVARGPVHYGTAHVAGLRGNDATVRACAMDAEIVVSETTGRPVPGPLGQVAFELFTSKMQFTKGGWKLVSQFVGERRCDHL